MLNDSRIGLCVEKVLEVLDDDRCI